MGRGIIERGCARGTEGGGQIGEDSNSFDGSARSRRAIFPECRGARGLW